MSSAVPHKEDRARVVICALTPSVDDGAFAVKRALGDRLTIVSAYLQSGGRSAFIICLVLAATLSPIYGIYGPAFEVYEARPLAPGSEAYLDSEKYQRREWPKHEGLRPWLLRLNRIRRAHTALQRNGTLSHRAPSPLREARK